MKLFQRLGCIGLFLVVGLAGWAWWQDRPKPIPRSETNEEFRKRTSALMEMAQTAPPPRLVAKIEPVAVTPLEAFHGYDRRYNIEISCETEPPDWWGKLSSSETVERGQLVAGDRILPRRAQCRTPMYRYRKGDSVVYDAFYLVRLDGYRGPLVLRDELPLFFGRKPIPNAAVKINIPLLKEDETAQPPKISREPGAVIEKVTVEKVSYEGEEEPNSAKVAVTYRQIEKTGARGVKVKVFDEKGKEWPIKPQFDFSSALGTSLNDGHQSAFTLYLDSIPLSAGKLTAKGYAFSGDKWPAPFSVSLRDAQGKIVEKRAPSIKFKIVNTDSVSMSEGSILLAVFVQGQGNQKKLHQVNWVPNPYPALVSDSGETRNLTPEDLSWGVGREDDGRDVMRLDWTLDKKLLPSNKQGWSFKTWIRADGGPQFRISIPLS